VWLSRWSPCLVPEEDAADAIRLRPFLRENEWPPRPWAWRLAVPFVNDAFNPGCIIYFQIEPSVLLIFFLIVTFWIFSSNSIFRKKRRVHVEPLIKSLKFPTVRLFLVDALDRVWDTSSLVCKLSVETLFF
jgi:hypothetical protein